MTAIHFETMKDLQRQADVVAMMHSLYFEDKAATPVDPSHLPTDC